ncbi:MAG: ABC transporter ATP-binding protein [Desulfurococcales archaeon]|nr:ABC transporter ATP-binding protein [Desulfurococcales archaeon]
MPGPTLIDVDGLVVEYFTLRGPLRAVDSATLEVRAGEILGIVGESGSGKSTLAQAILRILPPQARIVGGSIVYRGEDLVALSEERLKKIRWREISMVPQAALNALNPTLRIRDHFIETAKAHGLTDKQWILEKASELLENVRLDPDRVLPSYPHELSGGMKQRVLIALSLLLDPKIVILDEPTTALDVLTQRFILDLLKDLKEKLGITMVFITHDIAVVADIADRIAVMYAGQVVEVGDVFDVFYEPLHPYTRLLIKSVPGLRGSVDEMRPIPGSPPDMFSPPPGCRFHPRCPWRFEPCNSLEPKPIRLGTGRKVSCHLYTGKTGDCRYE